MQRHAWSKMVKICLNGKCKDIQIIPRNGFPVRCKVRVELSRDIPMTYPLHDIELYVPAEFGSLLEIGLPLTVTLDQTGN
jgi:hypothetical protein